MIITQNAKSSYDIDGTPAHEFVKRERLKRHLSMYKLAVKAACDHGSIIRFESGRNRSLPLLIKLLDALDFEVTISAVTQEQN